jgi:CBS domain containing-hemolysin-like protein
VVNIFTKKLLTLIGSTENTFITREELIDVIEGDTSIPKVDYRERIIKRIFRFSETTVDEIMIPLVHVRAPSDEAKVGDAVRMIKETGYSRIPIYTHRVDNITGMLHFICSEPTRTKEEELFASAFLCARIEARGRAAG